MRYAYQDLGEQPSGATAVVRWQGASAQVVLLDPVNFSKYVERSPFVYHGGGRYRRPPARLPIPKNGHWYVAVDLGGNVTNVEPTVEVQSAAETHLA
jgi:Domain of unknown function (DUF1883)